MKVITVTHIVAKPLSMHAQMAGERRLLTEEIEEVRWSAEESDGTTLEAEVLMNGTLAVTKTIPEKNRTLGLQMVYAPGRWVSFHVDEVIPKEEYS